MRRTLSLILIPVLMGSQPGWGTAYKACNGTPVRVKYPPMGIFWDQCSISPDSPQEKAFFSGMFETRFYALALGFGSGYKFIDNGRCIIDHDNDRSDVALVNRADIDGDLGLTMAETDGCNFSWDEEHIVTADVMVAVDLDFTRPDESAVIETEPALGGEKMGAAAMLHELGHALGLKHTDQFSIMRDGLSAGLPFVGMWPTSGGLNSGLTGDDVLGISDIYGFKPSYRNVFVSSQQLTGGAMINNDLGQISPVGVCPGDKVNLIASIGNDGPTTENVLVSVYTTNDPNDYFGFNDGLVFYTLNAVQGISSFPAQFTVPASMPANVTQSVFVSLPGNLTWDRKAYDNTARSRLTIRRKTGC